MKFENEFEVDAPVETVWSTVLDVEKVAPTVPGAKVLEQTGDNAYKVAFKVKLGPMTMQYNGDVEIVEADEASHRSVMRARAKEARGQGTADAEVTMTLSGEDGRTTGRIVTDVKVSGRAASMGRGVMQDVAGRMVGTFAENLAKMLADGEAKAGAGAEEAAASGAAGASGAAASGAASESGGVGESGAAEPSGAATGASGAAGESGGAAGESDDALDLGALGGAVAAERLRDPRVLVGLLLLAFLLGRRSAR
jgi:carbon monoxide dehydrogenase subunit G